MTRSLADALEAAAKRARHQRWEWCRLRNDFPHLPIWRAVARRAKVPVYQVVVVALCLECLANRSEPRGSVASLSIAELSAALDLRPDVVARVRSALEEPDISWIDQDFIVDFHSRNPDREDPTAAERQHRFRAKRKAAREQQLGPARMPAATGPPDVHSNVTSRVTCVTSRPEQSKPIREDGDRANLPGACVGQHSGLADEASGLAVANLHKSSGDGGDIASPELWLAIEGKRIVTERLEVQLATAEVRIARWKRDLDDPAALVEIIKAAEATDLMGARFHNLVVDQLRRRRDLIRGPQLPLPPAPVSKRSGHG